MSCEVCSRDSDRRSSTDLLKSGLIYQNTDLNCVYFVCVSGYLPVPELIIKGGEGLNLANFEELFIDTVNLTKKLGTISLIGWQFVIHGQGAKWANVPGLASCIQHFCNFYEIVHLCGWFFFAECKPGLRLIKILKWVRRKTLPRENFPNFPWCNVRNLCCTKD